ncbi:MAG: pantetheine-phosphate adenylyltransferase [Spirochaetes bacterium]|nr:pantetheine-phosphate adenylyltransferase [Spirochaetota bacterium]
MKKNRQIAIYPGTFDPVTYGHIDIINRAASIFEKVIVAVANNPEKNPVFTIEERVHFLQKVINDNKTMNIRIDFFNGLLVDFLKTRKANIVIRGLRVFTDFDYELAYASMNKKLFPDMETVFLMTNEKYSFISSSLVKEVARLGGSVKGYAPDIVVKALTKKLKTK